MGLEMYEARLEELRAKRQEVIERTEPLEAQQEKLRKKMDALRAQYNELGAQKTEIERSSGFQDMGREVAALEKMLAGSASRSVELEPGEVVTET